MKTFVINLENASERRKYMKDVLNRFPFLDIEFVDAVNGRLLTSKQKDKYFDLNSFFRRIRRHIRDGEIGCTLSHLQCYKTFLKSHHNNCLILEDDIDSPSNALTLNFTEHISTYMNTPEPTILLLSDWFWFTSSKSFDESHKIANLYEGHLSHAYVINRSAAKLLLSSKPDYIADQWGYLKKKGIRIEALIPHIIQQKWDGKFSSSIQLEDFKIKLFDRFTIFMKMLPKRIFMRFLRLSGKYYPPVQEKLN